MDQIIPCLTVTWGRDTWGIFFGYLRLQINRQCIVLFLGVSAPRVYENDHDHDHDWHVINPKPNDTANG